MPPDTVKGSRHVNLKELRVPGTNIRILFAFDPRRVAIFLPGGDKTNRWQQWYDENIPYTDALYETHLDELRQERRIAMSGRRNFKEISDALRSNPERRARIEQREQAFEMGLTIAQLCEGRGKRMWLPRWK